MVPGGPRRRRRHSWRYRLYANLEPDGQRCLASQSIAYRLRLLNPLSASARRSTVGSSGVIGALVGGGAGVVDESLAVIGGFRRERAARHLSPGVVDDLPVLKDEVFFCRGLLGGGVDRSLDAGF